MEARERHINSIRKAYRSGVRLATGTDLFINSNEYNVYGLNGMEILLLINGIGLTPLEALEAATVNASHVAGLDHEVGILKPKYKADFIAVKGNSVEDPSLLLGPENIHLVVKEGIIQKYNVSLEG